MDSQLVFPADTQVLFLSETFRFFDGQRQFFHELFVAPIRRQVQTVKARVAPW